MRARRWFRWHSLTGITGGLLLFVICWSGTVAVFSEEIDWLLNPAERVQPRGPQRMWGEWLEAAQRAYPQLRAESVHAPSGPRSAAEVWMETPYGQILRTYVDPYTARVTGQASYFNVQRFFRSLHMCLFDVNGTRAGYYVVGSMSFVLLGSLWTALAFYKRWWRQLLRFRPPPRAWWSHLHRSAGVWSLWFILIIAGTGLWYLVEIAGLDLGYPGIEPLPGKTHAVQPLDGLYGAARAAWPGLEITKVTLPGGYWGTMALFEGQSGAILVRDRANVLALDAASGEVLIRRTAAGLGWPARWVDTADPLHFGTFGGLVTKSIWFVFGLLLCALTLTGTYSYARRQRRHAPPSRGKQDPVMGPALVVSGCLLLTAAYGGTVEILDYSTGSGHAYPVPETPGPVTAFLGAWVIVTLAVLGWWIRLVRRPRPDAHEV